MAFKSLLLSKDADLVQTLTRLLKDLDIMVEACSEPFAAAKRLMDQQFDAILVDCEDEQGAGWVLQSARMATASKKSVTIAIVGVSASQGGPRAGENFVIQKPIVLKQVESTLRAARGLMGGGGTSPRNEAPASASSQLSEKSLNPVPATRPVTGGQGRPPAELFDELTAALDRLGPQGTPAKPMAAASAGSGAAAAAAPALEKPAAVPTVSTGPAVEAPPAWQKPVPVTEAPPRPEPLAQPVLQPAQQAWPGLAEAPKTPEKQETPAVLPLAATSAEMKPAVHATPDQARSNDALDNVRRKMNATAPPAWRTEVEERHETPAPRFAGFASEEEPSKGFPFKAVAVAMVLVSLALFGYSWYRGRHTASLPPGQAQAPAGLQQQAPAEAPSSAAPSSTPVPAGSDQADNSAAMANGSATEMAPAAPATPAPKPSKHEAARAAAEVTAPDTTSDLELPPAPLVVEGGQRHDSTRPGKAEAQVEPPSLNAVASDSKAGQGGMFTAPVAMPKLAAVAPQRIKVSQGVTQGLLVRQVNPQYPAMAREMRVEGDVVLEAVIGEDGTVRDLKAVSGPAMLVNPAIQAVRQWRYKPYLLNGQPVEVETQIKLRFRL